jgi:hypothetical protein
MRLNSADDVHLYSQNQEGTDDFGTKPLKLLGVSERDDEVIRSFIGEANEVCLFALMHGQNMLVLGTCRLLWLQKRAVLRAP